MKKIIIFASILSICNCCSMQPRNENFKSVAIEYFNSCFYKDNQYVDEMNKKINQTLNIGDGSDLDNKIFAALMKTCWMGSIDIASIKQNINNMIEDILTDEERKNIQVSDAFVLHNHSNNTPIKVDRCNVFIGALNNKIISNATKDKAERLYSINELYNQKLLSGDLFNALGKVLSSLH